jgi:hypothetical protein
MNPRAEGYTPSSRSVDNPVVVERLVGRREGTGGGGKSISVCIPTKTELEAARLTLLRTRIGTSAVSRSGPRPSWHWSEAIKKQQKGSG